MKKFLVPALLLALVGVAAAGAVHVQRSVSCGVCPLSGEPIGGHSASSGAAGACSEKASDPSLSAVLTSGVAAAAAPALAETDCDESPECDEAKDCCPMKAAAAAKQKCEERSESDSCKTKRDCGGKSAAEKAVQRP